MFFCFLLLFFFLFYIFFLISFLFIFKFFFFFFISYFYTMTYKRKITGVQQSGSKQKQRKSDEEYSDSAERVSSRGTSRGKRCDARGTRGTGELRRSQRISKAPAQGREEEGEDEGEDEEEEVLLTSTQQKALQTQQTPPIQQTQQRQMA